MTSESKTSTAAKPRKASVGGADLAAMRRPPTHPGEVLRSEFLEPLGFGAQSAAAAAMGMSLNRLNEILAGKRPVTPESALLLGALTGIDARFWLHMQADYDLWHALQRTDLSKIRPLREAVEARRPAARRSKA